MISQHLPYSLQSYVRFAKTYKRGFALTLSVFAVSNILLAVIPVFVGKLVGALADQPVRGHDAIIYAWVLVACSTLHNLTWRCAELLHRKYVNRISYEYESRLFEAVISKPYPYFVDKFTGKISSYISTMATELKQLTDEFCYNYLSHVMNIASIAIILTSINCQTGAIFTIGVIGMLIVGRYSIKNSNHYEKISADVNSNKNAKIIDAIANFVNVKSFSKESREIKQINTEKDSMVKAANTSYLWAIVFWASMSVFVRDLIWPLTIGVNVYMFLHGHVDIAQLTTVLSTALIFTSTIWNIVWDVSQATLRFARINEAHEYLFGKTAKAINPPGAQPKKPAFTRSISLHELSFAYPDKPEMPVLHGINLTLKKGEKIGIVGKSGSGKSTLTKLLLDYYQLPAGMLRIDDKLVSPAQATQLISYVPQDTTLFHRSIGENIAYASDSKVSLKDIERASKQAHAAEFINQTSDGYETLVGERGVKLSVGQRQRIAIARAFLDDKPVLILDEATSALDSESEVLVQDALEKLWEHKTVIAIAHRLSTLRHMDRIIVMDQGKIIEQGSHSQLLKQKGRYAKLWQHQSGGFIEE